MLDVIKIKSLILTTLVMLGFGSAYADYPTGYYDALVGKNKAALKTAACNVIRSHKNISYGDKTWAAFKHTDVRTENGKDYWWDMYSNNRVLISSGHPGMNIEHSVANSWWDGTKNDAYNDIHHLNPSDATANNRKGNYPLGIVGTVTWTNDVTIVGNPTSGTGGGSQYVYEPCDEYKGDFARVFFYMFTCYQDMNWGTRFTWMYNEGETYPMLKPWAYELMLQWSRMDPVSEKERNRNDAVYSQQGNRNPFIDLPELAEYIWGDKKDLPFTLSSEPGEPLLTSPTDGTVVNFGARQQGISGNNTITVKGVNMTGSLTLTVTGSEYFSVTPATLTADQAATGTSVSIHYSAESIGEHSGVLTIDGGGLTAPCRLTLVGSTVEKSELAAVTMLDPSNITRSSYRAEWTAATVTPDYYVVTRTYKVNGADKTRKYMTTDTWYDFTDRDFDNDERIQVQYAIGSDISAPSNVYLLKSGFMHVDAPEQNSVEIEGVNGGLLITSGNEVGEITIMDVSGRIVYHVNGEMVKQFFSLSQGIYIVTGHRLRDPYKIMVR